MVNTRRMESSGSAPDSGPRYHTRRYDERKEAISSSSESESELEESEEEDNSWSSQGKKGLPSCVKNLRSRYSHNEHKYTQHLTKRELRSRHKRISLDERRKLTVYSHKMHDDSDDNDLDDLYQSRAHRSRHLRHSKPHLSRIERRTALSLRPISLKSYADPHSPMNCNSDDSDVEKTNVRRSTRKKKVTDNMSWLADDQMLKVGYPNLDAQQYSEEDSRDAQDHTTSNIRRNTRRSHDVNGMSTRREIKKNSKYLYDYETEDINTSRRKNRNDEEDRPEKSNKLNVNRRDDKENKEKENISINRTNGRVKKERDVKVENAEEESSENKDTSEKVAEDQNKEKVLEKTDEKRDDSESEDVPIMTRRQNRLENRYPARRTRTRKMSDSSSSSEVGKVYSLRERPPKNQKSIKNVMVSRDTLSRRRFTRRRQEPTSSSTDSTDSDDRCRKPIKKNKPPKGHKNEQPLKSGAGPPIPIVPETLDKSVRFSTIGGLDSHIQCLKEMILLPMMYPEVFNRFHIQPPRGVLFYGPPGTGKTLIARALANECSFGVKKVTFFMRKGADLLSKWIGESERQLRQLFEQASQMKPSIIFFDELDGLAPVRSSRQDQIHASIVSTLLALMDGLENRGEVIVIGATNRIDAIDPALRRPGRFDRELFFPLPARTEREEILNVHVTKWAAPPSNQMISYLAEHAVGYCGSDLRALCSEAVIQSFRRTYPQVYVANYKLLLDPGMVRVDKIDFLRAKSLLVPASHRTTQTIGRKLLPFLNPLLEDTLKDVLKVLEKSFPHGLNPILAKVKLSAGVRPAQLLLFGGGPEHGQTSHLAPAILFSMEHIQAHLLDLATLYRDTCRSVEESCVQIFQEVRRNIPSILYIPNIDRLWTLINETVKEIILTQIAQLDPNSPILLLCTSDTAYEELDDTIRNIFSEYRKEVVGITPPNSDKRKLFFGPLIIDAALKPPRSIREKPKSPSPLPRAPTPPPTPMSEDAARRLYEQEERTLTELRIFLRDMCKKLANNKLFFMFTKPVDTEEVPDYTDIIKRPMDLETMMTKVDLHRYECAKDFLIDIELICQNALEYNPARSSADKQIRHRACSLRDYAYTLIKNEMDTDFEDKCQEIASKRKERKASVTKYLPAYIHTPGDDALVTGNENETEENKEVEKATTKENITVDNTNNSSSSNNNNNNTSSNRISPIRKRKFTSWQRGYANKRKRKKTNGSTHANNDDKGSTDDESKEKLINIELATMETSSEDVPDNVFNNDTKTNVDGNTQTKEVSKTPTKTSPLVKKNVNDLMSPSELLDDPLDFDDVDQALHESDATANGVKQEIQCLKEDLEAVLNEAVSITEEKPLHLLLDLHYQLSRILKQYIRTCDRKKLPNDFKDELNRFKESNELSPLII